MQLKKMNSMLVNTSVRIATLAIVGGLTVACHATLRTGKEESPNYHRIATYKLGGEGGWDYLISGPGQKLFISRGTHVMVVSEETGKVLGDIPDTTGVHGIAFSTRHNRGYTSNGRDNTVTEFDLTTFKVIKKIPVSGKNPDCIIFNPVADRVITCNGRSGDVSIIDPTLEKEIGTVQIGGKLEFAVSDSHGNVFVNNESTSEIAEIDPTALKLVKKWSIAPGEGPSGLAIDQKSNRLFSVTDGKLIISDGVAGKVVTSVAIGDGPDAAAFDASRHLAFSSNGGTGTLSVVRESSPNSFSVVQTVQTQPGARTMALDPKTHRIFLVTADFNAPVEGQRRPTAKPDSFTVLVYAP
jgi:DNA-binding beta-propeller fold protein YncE